MLTLQLSYLLVAIHLSYKEMCYIDRENPGGQHSSKKDKKTTWTI